MCIITDDLPMKDHDGPLVYDRSAAPLPPLNRRRHTITPAPSPGADQDQRGEEGRAMRLQEYETRKRVKAMRIYTVTTYDDGSGMLRGGPNDLGIDRASDWMEKHQPKAGGYFVQYPDGYGSYASADAFEPYATLVNDLPADDQVYGKGANRPASDAPISDAEKSGPVADTSPTASTASEDHDARYLRQRSLEMALSAAEMGAIHKAPDAIMRGAAMFQRYVLGIPETTPPPTVEEQLYGKRPT